MYRIVICEDEVEQREKIKNSITHILEDVSSHIKIFEYDCAEQFLEENPVGIDIYILDIRMGDMTGMSLAKVIRSENESAEIMFITSLVEYIQEGYKVRAYRYLLKPIKYEELKESILSCVKDLTRKKENFMILENRGSIKKIPIKDILYIEVIRRDIIVHTIDGEYCTKCSMDKVEKELKLFNFFRCHKSFLINMVYIDSIENNIVMIRDREVPVSKHRISNLRKTLTNMLGDILC